MVTAAEVSNYRFSPTKFREGYNVQQVDAFLERIRVALENIEQRPGSPVGLTPAEVQGARFGVTKFRAGYDQDEVDGVLDAVVSTLRAANP
jgi:DivIVA domain-containing protein